MTNVYIFDPSLTLCLCESAVVFVLCLCANALIVCSLLVLTACVLMHLDKKRDLDKKTGDDETLIRALLCVCVESAVVNLLVCL